MECVHCKKDTGVTILIEALPCKHCGGEIKVEYNVCKECGMAWKTVDGKILEDTTYFDVGLDEIFTEEDEEFLKEFDIVLKHSEEDEAKNMGDYIHKCFECQAPCFEVGENKWECPECGFTWEVLKG